MTEINIGRISHHVVRVMPCDNSYDVTHGVKKVDFSSIIEEHNTDKGRIEKIKKTVFELLRSGAPIPQAEVNFLTQNGVSIREVKMEIYLGPNKSMRAARPVAPLENERLARSTPS